MIDKKDLSRCIDLLADLNARIGANDTDSKRKLLEIGYILKTELNNVEAWDKSQLADRERGSYGKIDVKKLLEDNTQLFNENKKLTELNMKLRETIEKRIPQVEEYITVVNGKFESLENAINKL